MKEHDLRERLFRFAVDVLILLGKIKSAKEMDVIKYQLSKSATSSGANYSPCQIASNC